MSFNPPQHTLYLNNLGASAIRTGDLDQAITILAQALAAVKQRAHLNEEEKHHSLLHHRHNECDLSEFMSYHAMDASSKQHPSNTFVTVTDNEAYVHRYPIELPTTEKDGDEQHPISLMVTVQCMTILFNLALAFHLRGMRTPSTTTSSSNHQMQNPIDEHQREREFAVQNAIELYELCYEMMGSENMNPGIYFLMNLANNLGHCHGMLHVHDKSKKCFEHLLSMQMYMIDTIGFTTNGTNNSGLQASAEDNVMTTALERFFQNTSNLILNDCCASAA